MLLCLTFCFFSALACTVTNCHTCTPWSNDLCLYCEQHFANLGDGLCTRIRSLRNQAQFSLPAENVVFIQSDILYSHYQQIWTDMSGTHWDLKTQLHLSAAKVFIDRYGDNFDFVYTTSIQREPLCGDFTSASSCQTYSGAENRCVWQTDTCVLDSNTFFDRYAYEFPTESYSKFKGTIIWTPPNPSSTSLSQLFYSHFHEMTHHYVNRFQDGWDLTKSKWLTHWGAVGLEKWGMQGGFDQTQVRCDTDSGVGDVISPNSACPTDENGIMYLQFPLRAGSFEVFDNFMTSKYSLWELWAMNLATTPELDGMQIFRCVQEDAAQSQTHEYVSDGEYYKVSCDAIEWYSASDLLEFLPPDIPRPSNGQLPSAPASFSAAHIVLQPSSEPLPQTYDDLPEVWKHISNYLQSDLPNHFEYITDGRASISYYISRTTTTTTRSPSCSPSATAPTISPLQPTFIPSQAPTVNMTAIQNNYSDSSGIISEEVIGYLIFGCIIFLLLAFCFCIIYYRCIYNKLSRQKDNVL